MGTESVETASKNEYTDFSNQLEEYLTAETLAKDTFNGHEVRIINTHGQYSSGNNEHLILVQTRQPGYVYEGFVDREHWNDDTRFVEDIHGVSDNWVVLVNRDNYSTDQLLEIGEKQVEHIRTWSRLWWDELPEVEQEEIGSYDESMRPATYDIIGSIMWGDVKKKEEYSHPSWRNAKVKSSMVDVEGKGCNVSRWMSMVKAPSKRTVDYKRYSSLPTLDTDLVDNSVVVGLWVVHYYGTSDVGYVRDHTQQVCHVLKGRLDTVRFDDEGENS